MKAFALPVWQPSVPDLVLIAVTAVITVTGLGIAVVSRRKVRDRLPWHRTATFAAILVGMFLAADGMYRAFTQRLDLPPWEAVLLASVVELFIIGTGIRAERSIRVRGHTAGNAAMVFTFATVGGFIAASNTDNVTAFLVRFFAPIAVASAWWADASELTRVWRGEHGQATSTTTWLISPRRLAVRFGLMAPGPENLAEVTRARKVSALSRWIHRYSLAAGDGRRTARLRRRIHQLAETADAETVAQVRSQLERTRDALRLAGITMDAAPQPDTTPEPAQPAGGETPQAPTNLPRPVPPAPPEDTSVRPSFEEVFQAYATQLDTTRQEMGTDQILRSGGYASSGSARDARLRMRRRYADDRPHVQITNTGLVFTDTPGDMGGEESPVVVNGSEAPSGAYR